MKKKLALILLSTLVTVSSTACSSLPFISKSDEYDETDDKVDDEESDDKANKESDDQDSDDKSEAAEKPAEDKVSEETQAAIDLFDKLMDDPSGEELEEDDISVLEKGAIACESPEVIGKWNRTDVHMGEDGSITVEQDSDNTCQVSGYFNHYGNSGEIEGCTGYYLSDSIMFAYEEDSDTVFLFKVDDGIMEVNQKGWGCMGANASAFGSYTTGEPEYTNAHDIEDSFTEDELDAIKELLDDNDLSYSEYFETAILEGVFSSHEGEAEFEDDSNATGTWYVSFAPHGFTRNLNLFISEDGDIYLESGFNGDSDTEFYTTDDSTSTMPTDPEETDTASDSSDNDDNDFASFNSNRSCKATDGTYTCSDDGYTRELTIDGLDFTLEITDLSDDSEMTLDGTIEFMDGESYIASVSETTDDDYDAFSFGLIVNCYDDIKLGSTDEEKGSAVSGIFTKDKDDEELLLDSFLNGEIPVEDYNGEGSTLYISDMQIGVEEWDDYFPGSRIDLDNDGELEQILNGPNGGMYLDAEDDKITVLATSGGTAECLTYTNYDGAYWICIYDTSHGGRQVYNLEQYKGKGNLVDSFTLAAYYWDDEDDQYDEDDEFEFRGESITMEEYEEKVKEIFGDYEN